MYTETLLWVLLTLGCVPWQVSCSEHHLRHRRHVYVIWQVRAVFWSLTVKRRVGGQRQTWMLRVPLILRLSNAVWAALRKMLG